MKINDVQKLQFELIKKASFNNFDGDQVVKDLEVNRSLWIGCVMDRMDLIKLRDIKDNCWNVDTLYILTSGVNDEELYRLAKEEWMADEIYLIEESEACRLLGSYPFKNNILRIWWD